MGSEQKNKYVCFAKLEAEMKLRRHETYKVISAEKKEALLLQRRTKRRELKRSSLSENVAFPDATPAATEFQQQNIPLRSSSSVSKTANERHVDALEVTFDKRKIINYPFYSFEVGSTSHASNENSNMSSTMVGKKGLHQTFIMILLYIT
ncbi:uncharacterized protein LOC107780458 isoform X2 [Nicotiana tabacum]|uniref:Uncharacterized protein LOC107780458 isoform X2 n=1 Tax=Nicotiana tabacum TaxID=4097 RepID=A0AC58SA45_TOBAC